MSYGELKIDTITFTAGGVDASVSVSGLVQNPTFTGNITTTGTISGDVIKGNTISGVNVIGTTEVSGATVTGDVGLFGTITGGIHTLTSGVFASGTAANPSITFVDDLDTGLFTGAANTVSIGTNGGAVLTVSGTDVGIGTTSPTDHGSYGGTLEITGSPGGALYLTSSTDVGQLGMNSSGLQLRTRSAKDILFATNNTERARIDSSGRLLIGTSTSLPVDGFDACFQIVGNSQTTSRPAVVRRSNDNTPPGINFGKARGTSFQTVNDVDGLGSIVFNGADGTDLASQAAKIESIVDGTPASNSIPGCLAFSTTQEGNTSPTERLRIRPNGNITYTYSDSSTTTSTQTPPGLRINNTDNTLGRLAGIHFAHGGGGTANAGIFHVTTNTATPSTTCLGDLAFYMKASGSSTMTERMRLDSSGRLGIGTTSSQQLLHIRGAAANAGIRLESDGGSGETYEIRSLTNGVLTVGTTAENVLNVTSNSVGIGTTSPDARLSVFGSAEGEVANFWTNDTSRKLRIVTGTASSIAGALITLKTDSTVGELAFGTAGTERLRINSDGEVGIGTTNPGTFSALLEVNGMGLFTADGGGDLIRFKNSSSTANLTGYLADVEQDNIQLFAYDSSYSLAFGTNNLERARIDSSGRLLVGTTGNITGSLIQATINTGAELTLSRDDSTVTAGDQIGRLGFYGNDGGSYEECGRIMCQADGTHAGGTKPSRLTFWNTDTGFSNSSEKMRIHSGGKLTVPGVWNQTTTGGTQVNVESDGDLLRFTSSRKYKTDIETIEDARADAILNCRPVWYRSKCANDIKEEGATKSSWGWYGFIAEEVAEIEPRLVDWATKDAVLQEDGTFVSVERDPADYEAEGVRYNTFVPLLVNLIKRQKEQIEAMEARLSALEAQ
jgi:hypothetical protein